MLKLTFTCGKTCEGDSFTGSKGIKANPTSARQKKINIIEKDENRIYRFFLNRVAVVHI